MDIIHLLPDSVANQIAAGEVIQRPASCLKELVENSLDAGATRIQVIVRDAGRTLLQVIDNGIGMSEMDARLAFERHATSKIREAQDLFTLRTMGFRGEALPSICAVSQVEMMTRRPRTKTPAVHDLERFDPSRRIRDLVLPQLGEQALHVLIGNFAAVEDLFLHYTQKFHRHLNGVVLPGDINVVPPRPDADAQRIAHAALVPVAQTEQGSQRKSFRKR